jgi:hypothetical protein
MPAFLNPRFWSALAVALLTVTVWAGAAFADISRFVGVYVGSAEVVEADGTTRKRDMSVSIEETRTGFRVKWTSVTHKGDGRSKEKSYEVNFRPSERPGIFAAAMTQSVFGHAVPLDPMKGEPYVWGRIEGDTLTVFSLFVDDTGGYEMQQFDRTLAPGGLKLEFSNLRNGKAQKTVSSFLRKQ